MKKLSIVFGIVLVALIALVEFRPRRVDDSTTAKAPATGHLAPRERLESSAISARDMRPPRAATRKNADSERENVESLRRELETARTQLEKITRPLQQDVLSSTVNAEINPGETLVTGGYRTADGNYELTFLTPRGVTLEDGREAIEVDSKVLSVGSEFVGAHGLEAIATNARNTLQHAEAWKQEDVAKTLAAGRDAEGVGVMTGPKVTVLPSTSFTLSIGEKNGAQFSIEGTVARSPNGSYAIQSRIERTPKE
jgi:hypothetical protein